MPFFNITKVGKQLKESYKFNKLRVGCLEDYSVMVAGKCLFAVREQEEPNKLKAVITELVGYNPTFNPADPGLGFVEVKKDEAERNLEPEEVKVIQQLLFNVNSRGQAPEGYAVTPAILVDRGQQVRIIQSKRTLECKGILQEHLDMISYADLDYNKEGEPTGPGVVDLTGTVYYQNETCVMAFALYNAWTEQSIEALRTLQLLDLRGDKK